MLVFRWQAPSPPSTTQIQSIIRAEGLEPIEEILAISSVPIEKKHPFSEIRFVAKGELLVNVAGNRLLLCAGDRVEIPANTRHSYVTQTIAYTFYSHRAY